MRLLGANVSPIEYHSACNTILQWAEAGKSRYICVANVHVIMEAYDSEDVRRIVNEADLTVPDGMPLVWMMRMKGARYQGRVYGPTLMLHILDAAVEKKIPLGFYGGSPEVSKTLIKAMLRRYAGLNVVFSMSPPFRELSLEEEDEVVEQINQSGVRILFVGLGCPKQELWMAAHRGKVNAVMIGVGAAFDFHAGAKPQAPAWIQRLGLEWSFRLATEPRRLWRRYLYHNPRFVFLAIADLFGMLRD